jgi:hypothetical protein
VAKWIRENCAERVVKDLAVQVEKAAEKLVEKHILKKNGRVWRFAPALASASEG